MGFKGYNGNGYANSWDSERKKLSGTLTSPEFTIERNYLCFLLAGWAWDPKTSLQLLINGRLEFSAYGLEDNKLRPYAFDVSSFPGCKARFVICDAGAWEHIAVDDIVASDLTGPETRVMYPRSRSVPVDKTMELSGKRYLEVPINISSEAIDCLIECDGTVKTNLSLRLATNMQIDFWTSIPIYQLSSRNLRIFTKEPVVYEKNAEKFHNLINLADEARGQAKAYRESGRPQLHFTPERGGNGDVVGLFYYKGLYHVFYLHDPALDKTLANACWGHATSKDLFHWTEQPIAIWKELNHPKWSGGGLVDENNYSGLKTNEECPILLFCSKETQNAQRYQIFNGDTTLQTCEDKLSADTTLQTGEDKLSAAITLQYSIDGGKTFQEYHNNPLFYTRCIGGHDPKVIWYEKGKKWVMILHDMKDGVWGYDLYESQNMLEWKYMNSLKDWWETPELFQLPLDGDKDNMYWIVKEVYLAYKVGNFDGHGFQPLTEKIRNYFGSLAPQTFSNVPGNRRILMASLYNSYYKDYHDLPVYGGLAIPMELTLRTTSGGPRLFYNPVKEIDELVETRYSFQDISSGEANSKFKNIKFGLFDIELEWSCKGQQDFSLVVGGRDIFAFNAASSEFKFNSSPDKPIKPLISEPVEGSLKIRIIADHSVVSFYINDGYYAGNLYLRDFTPVCSVPLNINGKEDMIFTKIKVNDLRSPLISHITNMAQRQI